MTVREIAVGDLEGLLRLYTELHENPMPAQGETLSALWHGILEDKNHHIVVAEKKGEIVSSCVVLVVPAALCPDRKCGYGKGIPGPGAGFRLPGLREAAGAAAQLLQDDAADRKQAGKHAGFLPESRL